MLKVEMLLRLTADMESLAPAEDKLSALISELDADELMDDELDMVAAAATRPSYSRFLELAKSRGIKGPASKSR